MRSPLQLFAPAKLNLGLRIVGVRADGYHELDSLFVPLDWGDDLELELLAAPGPAVELALLPEPPFVGSEQVGPEAVPTDERNLAVRAARRFLERGGLRTSVRLTLRKRVPAGAGLGGGSSDAAAVLRGLAECFPGALAPEALAELALGLGADVPFFLAPRPSRVRGIGERIEPLAAPDGLDDWWLVLANPGTSVATAPVYAAYDADRGGSGAPAAALTLPGAGSTMRPFSGLLVDPPALGALLQNDLEPAASRLCPAIQLAKERLERAGAVAGGMSGSGATVFGVFGSERAARAACGAWNAEEGSEVGPGQGWSLTARILTRWPRPWAGGPGRATEPAEERSEA